MVNGRIDDRAIFRYKSFLRAWCYWSRIKSSGLWHHTYIRDEIEWHQMKTHADFVFQQYIFTHVARSFHQAICNYFLTWISAQVKEMGGFAFRNCEIHFSLVFWVRNAWKMWFSRYRSKIKHFSLVSNPKYAGKVNFTVSKNKPTHFLHLCGNPSKKIVIF